jgi:rod shape-determining protein MreD
MPRILPNVEVPIRTPLTVAIIPTATVLIATLFTMLPVIANAPLMPPLGFVMLLAWRMLRSDLWPVWIGAPLGLFDDLVTGQPVGSAVALWTIVMLTMDALDRRVVWRDYWIDWIIAGIALLFVLVSGAMLARVETMADLTRLIGPQWLLSFFLMPAAMVLVARIDRWRLKR